MPALSERLGGLALRLVPKSVRFLERAASLLGEPDFAPARDVRSRAHRDVTGGNERPQIARGRRDVHIKQIGELSDAAAGFRRDEVQ